MNVTDTEQKLRELLHEMLDVFYFAPDCCSGITKNRLCEDAWIFLTELEQHDQTPCP